MTAGEPAGTAPLPGDATAPAVILVDVRAERRGPMRSLVEMALGGHGTVIQVANADDGLAAVERYHAMAAVLEVQMPLADGLAGIAALRAAHPSLLIIICTFNHDPVTKQLAEAAGADAYLVKPVSTRQMRTALSVEQRAPLAQSAVR
jgi:DNA-binding response OmpR family regulator